MEKIKEMLLKGPLPTQGMLVARILVGGYLIYLSKSLFDGRGEAGMSPVVLYLFIFIFLLIGAFLCLKAVLTYILGYYKGGKLDENDTEAEIIEPEDAQPMETDKNTVIDVEESEIEELDK